MLNKNDGVRLIEIRPNAVTYELRGDTHNYPLLFIHEQVRRVNTIFRNQYSAGYNYELVQVEYVKEE
jgi:hypothetical protein